MNVDGAPSADEGAAPQQTFPLSIITLIRTAQGQNGVKHGDYSRYRRHCKSKLASLYKTLKFQHGRTKFIKRKIEASTVTDVRFLHIPIFSAERAWAYAMDLKKQIEGDMDLQKKRHLVARMRKAATWGRDVARLASVRCDARGALEAEGYSAFLTGSALVEEGKTWSKALALLTRAKSIFTSLANLGGTAEMQALYLQFVEELEAPMRYCSYQLSRAGAATPSEAELLATAEKEESILGSSQVQSHLKTLASETTHVAAPSASSSIDWLGRSIPVRTDRLQAAVAQVHSLTAELSNSMDQPVDESGSTSAKEALYDKLIKALVAARGTAQQAIKGSTVPETDQTYLDLTATEQALVGLIATKQVELAELQARGIEARFARGLEKAAAAGVGKKMSKDKDRRDGAKAEEVVRLLDTLQHALAELSDVGARSGGRAGEELYEAAAAKLSCVRAARTYYTAHSMLAHNKPLEAYALFNMAGDRATAAAAEVQDKVYAEHSKQLAANSATFKLIAQAEYAAAAASQREGVEAGMGGLGLVEAAGAQPGTKYLMEALDSWEAFAGNNKAPRVYPLPYSMQAIPCRPIMLDTAADHLGYPDIEHRVRKTEKKSVLSSLAGWAWGAKK